MSKNFITTNLDIPWPKLGLEAFQSGSNPATAANLKWFGMGTTEGYAEGYKKAIERIVLSLRDPDTVEHPDQFFYPVAFLGRHYFELLLKHLILEGSKLIPPTVTVEDLSRNHCLESLWKQLRPRLESIWPDGSVQDLDAVEMVLNEFHRLDPGGTVFRYDSDQKGTSHAQRLPDNVDLERLWETVRDIGSFLEACSGGINEHLSSVEC